jgi:hypothetical protein
MVALLDIYSKSLRKQNKNDEAARVETQVQSMRPAQPATPVTEAPSQTKTDTKTETKTEIKTDAKTAATTVAPTSTPVLNLQETHITKSEKQDAPKTTTEVKTETITK